MKIIFFGSSDFSIPPLQYCLGSGHEVAAVVTTPDKPKGRGLQLMPNPVHAEAKKAGVGLFAPPSLKKDPEIQNQIASLKPDLFVVASYGKLIPASWLSIPKNAALNIHPSLLPRHRGAAPITWQILEGDPEAGVSIAEVTPELDAGDLFCQLRLPLNQRETTPSLTQRLSDLAVEALKKVLVEAEKGTLKRTPQDHSCSTYARKLTKEDGELHWNESAQILDRKIRAYDPWPGAFVSYQGKSLRLAEAECDSISCSEGKAGTLLEIHREGHLRIQAGKGSLRIFKVQLPGKQVISGKDFANGQRLKPGFVFEIGS